MTKKGTGHSSKKANDRLEAYSRKIDQLFTGKKSVSFDAHEYLRLAIERTGSTESFFSAKLQQNDSYITNVLRNHAPRLPITLAQKLAQLSVKEEHQNPLYWMQTEYTLNRVEDVPQLDLSKTVTSMKESSTNQLPPEPDEPPSPSETPAPYKDGKWERTVTQGKNIHYSYKPGR